MKNFVKLLCRFCDKELEDFLIIPSVCDCEGAEVEKSKQAKVAPTTPDLQAKNAQEYDRLYPKTFSDECLVKEKDEFHKLRLEARNFGAAEGLTISIPFPYFTGKEIEEEGAANCFDLSKADAKALFDLLKKYLKKV